MSENEDILEELGQAVYIADLTTHEMLYMNAACRRLMDCRDFAGRKCYEISQGLDSPCPFCTSSKLKEGEICSWEHDEGGKRKNRTASGTLHI